MSERPAKPTSLPTDRSAPYWAGLAAGELLLQACADCGVLRHYPRLLCDRCYSDQVCWQAASGRGAIHSWTVAHHAFHPAFAHELPYTLVTVDLAEGPRALGRWSGGALAIGLPVHGRIVTRDGLQELLFDPADNV